jgi:hypothetical protein
MDVIHGAGKTIRIGGTSAVVPLGVRHSEGEVEGIYITNPSSYTHGKYC